MNAPLFIDNLLIGLHNTSYRWLFDSLATYRFFLLVEQRYNLFLNFTLIIIILIYLLLMVLEKLFKLNNSLYIKIYKNKVTLFLEFLLII
jgi:hypothetical protein